MQRLISPLRWAGGKSKVARLIALAIPPHRTYVEPFGGAASVLFAKRRSDVEVYNDINGCLTNFFRVLRDDPEGFIASFKWELVSRSEYERLTRLDPTGLSPTERAYRFYYLVMAGWGAEAGRFRFQVSARDRGGNRLGAALANLEQRILPVHERLQRVIIEEDSWENVISRYDGPDTFFYVDPPYPKHRVRYGHDMRDVAAHERLWRALASAEARFLLSSYDDPALLRKMKAILGDSVSFHPLAVPWGHRSKKKPAGREILVANYDLPAQFLSSAATAPRPAILFGGSG